MTGLACRMSVLASALLVVAASRSAWASDPVGVYVAAARVDTMPDDATATTVAIHGAFILLKSDGSWMPPQCGYMYFKCPTGSEDMCRMQWQDIRKDGTSKNLCAGFGTLNMVTTATIRSEGTPLAAPDDWDLGLGVTRQGTSIGGQCQPAKALACHQLHGR